MQALQKKDGVTCKYKIDGRCTNQSKVKYGFWFPTKKSKNWEINVCGNCDEMEEEKNG